ncbi:MAG: triosephosphate isomerase [Flavobacteriia bacterium]|nr:triosephosphate isomerase [Flavobacteriia bacterium]
MSIRFIGANWKMNLTLQEAKLLYRELEDAINNELGCEVVVFIPQPFLGCFESTDNIQIAAQNFHAPELSGAFTGETSLAQLKSLNINTVLVGHSERRLQFNESDELVMLKAKTAVQQGFKIVLCCGEPIEVRRKGEEAVLKYLMRQISELSHWNSDELNQVILAYEPIWAIGTGSIPSINEIRNIHTFLRSTFHTLVIYGGSCDASNSNLIFREDSVAGGLIGGASLQAESFIQIVKNACTPI